MANTDKPRGLTPVRHLNGNPWNGACEKFHIAASYGTALFVGDPVAHAGTAHTDGTPQIQAAGASGTPIGVIVGFEVDGSNLEQLYNPASTAGYAYVCVAPDVIYEIQEDGDVGTAGYGLNADCVATAGDTATGRSRYELDSSTAATTNLMLRILGLVKKPDNEVGTNSKLEVMINDHRLRSTTGV